MENILSYNPGQKTIRYLVAVTVAVNAVLAFIVCNSKNVLDIAGPVLSVSALMVVLVPALKGVVWLKQWLYLTKKSD